jgi:hypothetical protein
MVHHSLDVSLLILLYDKSNDLSTDHAYTRCSVNNCRHEQESTGLLPFFVVRTTFPFICTLWTQSGGTGGHTRTLTFIMVLLETGTNFPAVSVNCLLAVAMMKSRQR